MFVVALLLRAGFGLFQHIRADDASALAFPDERQYWQIARSLRTGEGLRDELGFRATRMPLYPAVLALFAGTSDGVIIARGVHWIVGAAVAALTAGAASSLFDRRVGLIAGLFVALDPFLVFVSSLLLTETFFMAALVGLWWVAAPIAGGRGDGGSMRRWLAVGVLAALAIYLRESSLGLVAVLFVFVAIRRRLDPRALAGVAVAGGVVAASLVPWAMRNRYVTGQWCWLTHRGGISLYDGVGPGADGSSDLGDIKQMTAVRGLGEAAWNRYFLRESVKAIREEPGRILRLAGIKLRRLWNPFPNIDTHQSRLVRAISAGWTLPIFALAVAGAILLPKLEDRARTGRHSGSAGPRGLKPAARGTAVMLLLPALYVSAVHSLFVGSVRYRLIAMPMLEMLAAVALAALLDHFRRKYPGRGSASDH